MIRHTLRVITREGERLDEVCQSRDGLAVTESGCPNSGSLFTVTHVASGCAVASFYRRPDAVRAMELLLRTELDWTESINGLGRQFRERPEARLVVIEVRNRSDIPAQHHSSEVSR